MVIVECACCGKEIETYPSRIKRYKERNSKFYCSKECKSVYWSEHRTGENHPRSKSKVEVRCAWCDKNIMLPGWRVERSDRHFCNSQCKGNWQSKHKKGPSSPCYKAESHITVECEFCGKQFQMKIQQYTRYKNHYCSKECTDNAKRGKSCTERKSQLHECICPICGKVFLQSKNTQHQRKTCSLRCGVALRAKARNKRVTLNCRYCGKQYSVHNCEKERSKYCSRSCLALAKMVDGHSNTLPERLLAEKLMELAICFISQYPIDRMKVDFYLPDINTVIEVYGDYWHANPQKYGDALIPLNQTQIKNIRRDKARLAYLRKCGYSVCVFWECDIKKDLDSLMATINRLYGNPSDCCNS